MDSRKFGSAVLATVSIDDKHLDVFNRVANALNKQQSARATAMATMLEQCLVNLETAVEPPKPKTLEERYEAFSSVLKAKLTLENGRLYFTVQGAGIKANLWGARLKSGGHELLRLAKDVLSKPDYDKNHRLQAGKTYKLGLVFGTEIAEVSKRSTAALQDFGCREFGPQATECLKAELALLIREKFTNAELEVMGLWYIAVLHKPIIDSDGNPSVLCSFRVVGSYVDAYDGDPSDQWVDDGAFASLAS